MTDDVRRRRSQDARDRRRLDASSAARELVIETPSWGYGDSGTRFARLPAARPPARRLRARRRRRRGAPADRHRAARWRCTSRGTRSTTSARCARTSRRAGCGSARSTRTCSRTPTTSSARSRNPDAAVREKAVAHLARVPRDRARARLDRAVAVVRRRHELPRPGRPARAPRAAARRRSREVYAALPAEQELLVEYKLFEPAFYATDLADWGSALLSARSSASARGCWSTSATTPRA